MLQNRYKASIDFFKIYPQSYQSKLQKLIWYVPVDQREKVWKEEKIPYKKIEKAFIKLVKQRNKHAKEKKFKSNLELFLNLYKIPEYDYYRLQSKFEEAVKYCNSILVSERENLPANFYTEFGNHCYICLIDKYPVTGIKNVMISIYKFDNKIHLLEKKIKIIKGQRDSRTERGNDIFNIYINNNQNSRHQLLDFVHEIFHLKNNDNLQNRYLREKETINREIEFYKKYYPELYKALIGEFLKVFHRVLFEIELYKNPDRDLSKLYASTFKQCYTGARQNKNRSYILDDLIIRHPFQNLPHFLAQIDIVLSLIGVKD